MIVYFLLFVMVYFLSNNRRVCKVRMAHGTKLLDIKVISCMILALFLGFRACIGVDDAMYVRTFDEVISYGKSLRNIEYSYVLLSKMVDAIGGTYQLLFLIYAVLSCYFLYKGLKIILEPNCWSIFFGIFMSFLFIDSLIAMRQFLAMTILFSAYAYYVKENKKISILLAVFGVLIHHSAIVGIIVFLFRKVINEIPNTIKVIILAVLYILQYIPWVQSVIRILAILPFVQGNYYLKYYLNFDAHIYRDPVGIVTTIYIILYCFILLYGTKHTQFYLVDGTVESLSFVYFAALLFFSQIGAIVRISYYFSIFYLIYLSRVVYIVSKNSREIFKWLCFCAFGLLFLFSIAGFKESVTNNNVLIPYEANFVLFKG